MRLFPVPVWQAPPVPISRSSTTKRHVEWNIALHHWQRTVYVVDDEVRMVPLQRVVHEPEVRAAAAFGEGPLDLADDSGLAQRWQIGAQSQRHVRRQRRSERLA